MKLKKLIHVLPQVCVKGSKDIEITGLCCDSRCSAPGNLFVAKKGHTCDGTQFIGAAMSAGAHAVLTDIYNPVLREITQVIVPDVIAAESLLATHYYGSPSDELFMVGITGTSGKTTTACLVKHLLEKVLRAPCAMMGTIETVSGQHRCSSKLTTADVLTNHKVLRDAVVHGCQAAVMEVSSHALEQKRVAHIHYDVAVFTNLSPEHLDYHESMENYAAAKKKLFEGLTTQDGKERKRPPCAIINSDDGYGREMARVCRENVITYGMSAGCDLMATELSMEAKGLSCQIHYRGDNVFFRAPFVGRHNAYNLLAAMGVGLACGVPFEELAEALTTAPAVRGRLEEVPNALGLQIYVDYAHKEEALRVVLEALRLQCRGRLIVVFGCGGNRDKGKRPRMASVAEKLSDRVIVTSDNPRHEDPEEIIKQIVAGFSSKARYEVEIDRKAAIAKAVAMAQSGDIILIAGKGHEEEQIFAYGTIPFDDRKVAQELCEKTAMEQGQQ